MNEGVRTEWPGALTTVVAATYVWIGVVAEGWDRACCVAGGLVILLALVVARRFPELALVLFVAGTVPLAASTWWSIATPVLALAALTLGWMAAHSLSRSRRVAPGT